MSVVSVVIGALGMFLESFGKRLENLEIGRTIDIIQTLEEYVNDNRCFYEDFMSRHLQAKTLVNTGANMQRVTEHCRIWLIIMTWRLEQTNIHSCLPCLLHHYVSVDVIFSLFSVAHILIRFVIILPSSFSSSIPFFFDFVFLFFFLCFLLFEPSFLHSLFLFFSHHF